ncbi:hypothetical protein C7E18_18115, partial [Stenotrophomonas maltophilia]
SMNADRIYADPSTITGSIGIFGMVPNFSRALDKWWRCRLPASRWWCRWATWLPPVATGSA